VTPPLAAGSWVVGLPHSPSLALGIASAEAFASLTFEVLPGLREALPG